MHNKFICHSCGVTLVSSDPDNPATDQSSTHNYSLEASCTAESAGAPESAGALVLGNKVLYCRVRLLSGAERLFCPDCLIPSLLFKTRKLESVHCACCDKEILEGKPYFFQWNICITNNPVPGCPCCCRQCFNQNTGSKIQHRQNRRNDKYCHSCVTQIY